MGRVGKAKKRRNSIWEILAQVPRVQQSGNFYFLDIAPDKYLYVLFFLLPPPSLRLIIDLDYTAFSSIWSIWGFFSFFAMSPSLRKIYRFKPAPNATSSPGPSTKHLNLLLIYLVSILPTWTYSFYFQERTMRILRFFLSLLFLLLSQNYLAI